jgi:hypothetical protein
MELNMNFFQPSVNLSLLCPNILSTLFSKTFSLCQCLSSGYLCCVDKWVGMLLKIIVIPS